MKLKSLSASFLSVTLIASMAQARSEQLPTMHTATTAGNVTTTTLNSETIQTLGQQAEANTNKGKSLANAGMAITAVGVAATCWASWGGAAKACKMFVGGLVATTAIRLLMSGASGKSGGTVAAVSTTPDPNSPGVTDPGTQKPTLPDYTNEADYQNSIKTIKKLTDSGWKIDTGKGTIVDPKGNKFTSAIASSPSAASAAGIPDSTFAAFQKEMSKVPALAAEKMKAADSAASAYDDSLGGTGGSAAAAAADGGLGAYGGLPTGSTGQKLGVDRDPAQVAGMTKDFKGNPIGVSQDSLFMMIDRRYDMHKKNGSFLSQ